MTKHIIFDLDGTLIDSKQEIIDTYRQVFERFPSKKVIDFDKLSFTATLQNNLEFIYDNDPSAITRGKELFAEIYDQSFFEKTLLYEGVYSTLENLFAKGISLYVATNKRLKPTLRILEQKKMSPFFKVVKASDQTPGKMTSKEDMVRQICEEQAIENGIMIGDGEKDIEAGQACGLATVAVTYGYEKKEGLIKKKPTFVIDSFTELSSIIN